MILQRRFESSARASWVVEVAKPKSAFAMSPRRRIARKALAASTKMSSGAIATPCRRAGAGFLGDSFAYEAISRRRSLRPQPTIRRPSAVGGGHEPFWGWIARHARRGGAAGL